MPIIVIADRDRLCALGMSVLCQEETDFQVAGIATTAAEALTLIEEANADVLITELQLDGSNGIDLITQLKSLHPQVGILVFTSLGDDEYLFQALHAGAEAYVLKGSPISLLLQALRSVVGGAAWLDPLVQRRVLSAVPQATHIGKDNHQGLLSPREQEVLKLVCNGMDNRSIGRALFISEETVKTHVRHIMEKLHANGRTQAAVRAFELGIVS